MPKPKTPLGAFAGKYEPVTESGCWIWTGACNGKYGLRKMHGLLVTLQLKQQNWLLKNKQGHWKLQLR